MKKICFILTFFSNKSPLKFWKEKKFPLYFNYFINTFDYNKEIDLKIFTDISFQEYSFINEHIKFYPMSFSAFNKKASKALGLKINPDKPYKVCDLRPSYGIIFEEHLKKYDFWGYCDTDMIMGNLRRFISDDLLNNFEAITSGSGANNPHYPNGYMMLYENCGKMNNLYSKSKDYRWIFEDKKNYRFDENGGDRNIVSMCDVIEQEQIKICHVPGLVHNDGGSFNNNRPWLYVWDKGQLVDTLTDSEVGSLHLMKSKSRSNFQLNYLNLRNEALANSFYISAEGIFPHSPNFK
ncbi:DUF6625 family protein [Cyanobacterium sp. IPPAS B-1200]|uniref:DUF6625 family protein n=1 Tax=Cyanobacterium sp. IPPAS B-1200 TaxID=1562720 RepID=UPI0008528B90|nr:DUF6625 family protein [Cyanobacterium sp. IPPAS B-1200]OEJ77523.1 hypothetical protein A5482_05455 [Cyanobacterium sp. IPPAS B-1200]